MLLRLSSPSPHRPAVLALLLACLLLAGPARAADDYTQVQQLQSAGQTAQALAAADAYIKEFWDTCQSLPDYKGSTTFIITCDHGRGDNTKDPKDWNNHGAKHPGSGQIWIGILGPDTPALGERHDCEAVTQSQIAATIAALLGEDYNAAQPKAGLPIKDALPAPMP